MNTIEDIANEIEVITSEIEDITRDIDYFELDEEKYKEQYEEQLNEEEVIISGIRFDPAMILKELDPIAYDSGLSDYLDSLSLDDDDEYIELKEKLEELEEELEELKEKLEELENFDIDEEE